MSIDLARSIADAALPGLVRDYLSVLGSTEDPETLRKGIGTLQTLVGGDKAHSATVVNVTFDMSNGLRASTTIEAPPVPVEAIEAPAKDDESDFELDLHELLGAPQTPST